MPVQYLRTFTARQRTEAANVRLGRVLAFVLFAIVAAIWLTLIAQVVRVRRVCRPVGKPRPSSA